MERVKTGIKGFDFLLQGGFTENSTSLVIGVPGTGKTIFSLEYLYRGAEDYNERGVYISFEQPVNELEQQAEQFGWDLKKLQKKKKIKIVHIPIEDIHRETLDKVGDIVKSFKADRLIIDSISTLAVCSQEYSNNGKIPEEHATRFFIYEFINTIKRLDCTTLLTAELKQEDWLRKEMLAEFIVDTVILLKYFGAVGESSRTISIKKARRTKFNEFIHGFEFTKKGIVIKESQKLSFVK